MAFLRAGYRERHLVFFGAQFCCCLVLFLTLLLHFYLPVPLYVALVVLLFTCARRIVMEPSTNAAEPGTNAAERRLYVQFFQHLGITEQKNMTFLCSLLRNLYDAASKLDLHLAPYGAALHCAVSRMVVSTNPQEAPTHRWIRVVDRLGFFTDANSHSERIVNLGLAFAYRHLEADALAEANALLLRKSQPASNQQVAPTAGALPRGGAVVSTTTDDPAAAARRVELEPGEMDRGGDDGEQLVPMEGRVISANGLAGELAGRNGSLVGDGREGEGLLPPGGMVVSTTILAPGSSRGAGDARRSGASGSAGAGDDADDADSSSIHEAAGAGAAADVDDTEVIDDGDSWTIPPYALFDEQPTVQPSASAVKVVVSVLRTVMDKPDGKDVLRKLLIDGLLCLARSRLEPPPAGTTRPTGAKAEADAIWRMCRAWWPHWKAPQDLGSTKPPDGTLAFLLNRKRLAASSRWAILVNMTGTNSALEDLSVKTSRFFKKNELPAVECVQRVSGKAPMKLTVVVACLLLMVTKEEGFGPILTDLAFAGRSDVNKNAPLTTASRHEFYTAGLGPSSSTSGPAQQAGSASTGGAPAAPAAPSFDVPALQDYLPQDLDVEYAAMESDVAADKSKEATRRRAQRKKMLKEKPRPRTGRPPTGRPASAASESTASDGSAAAPAPASTAPGPRGAMRSPVATRGRRPPRPAAAEGDPSGVPNDGATVVRRGASSTAPKQPPNGAKKARAPRPRKVAASTAQQAAPAVIPARAGAQCGSGVAPAGHTPQVPPSLAPVEGAGKGALAGHAVSSAGASRSGDVARAWMRDVPNVVVGVGVSPSAFTAALPTVSPTFSSLPDQSIETEWGGAGSQENCRGDAAKPWRLT